MHLQDSLLDLADEVGIGSLDGTVQRIELGRGAWVDLRPNFIQGASDLFERLVPDGVGGVDWRAERRTMWDKEVDTPRLLRFYGSDEPWPDPVLAEARDALSCHYRGELGEPFTTIGMCLYRDGRDSVAWHGDRGGRASTHDTMVAIVSLGATRALMVRPAGGGGASRRFELASGDLVVMGGSCQRTFDHCVPKTAQPVGPRISVQFRPHGVR